MNSKDTYRLNEANAQKRLAEFQAENNVTLEGEIAAAKLLLEEALQQKSVGTSLAILNVISNLVKSHRLEATRTGELLSRNAVRKLGKEIGDRTAIGTGNQAPSAAFPGIAKDVTKVIHGTH